MKTLIDLKLLLIVSKDEKIAITLPSINSEMEEFENIIALTDSGHYVTFGEFFWKVLKEIEIPSEVKKFVQAEYNDTMLLINDKYYEYLEDLDIEPSTTDNDTLIKLFLLLIKHLDEGIQTIDFDKAYLEYLNHSSTINTELFNLRIDFFTKNIKKLPKNYKPLFANIVITNVLVGTCKDLLRAIFGKQSIKLDEMGKEFFFKYRYSVMEHIINEEYWNDKNFMTNLDNKLFPLDKKEENPKVLLQTINEVENRIKRIARKSKNIEYDAIFNGYLGGLFAFDAITLERKSDTQVILPYVFNLINSEYDRTVTEHLRTIPEERREHLVKCSLGLSRLFYGNDDSFTYDAFMYYYLLFCMTENDVITNKNNLKTNIRLLRELRLITFDNMTNIERTEKLLKEYNTQQNREIERLTKTKTKMITNDIRDKYINKLKGLEKTIKAKDKTIEDLIAFTTITREVEEKEDKSSSILNPDSVKILFVANENTLSKITIINSVFKNLDCVDGLGNVSQAVKTCKNYDLILYKYDEIKHTAQVIIDKCRNLNIPVIYLEGSSERLWISKIFNKIYN